MKILTVILAVVCVLLGFALYKRNASAGRELDALIKDQQSLSNQVTEVRTRLALEQGTALTTTSNLQHALTARTASLVNLSNRLVQTHLLLQAAQEQGQELREDLQAKAARIAALDIEKEELQRKAPAVSSIESELKSAKEGLALASRERDALAQELGRLKVEQAAITSRLLDPQYLRTQLEKAEEEALLRQRAASARAGASPDRRLKLELQPDGTVRYATPSLRPVVDP